MLVTNRQAIPLADYLSFIKACAVSGITSVQLREKHQSWEFLLMFGQELKRILDPLRIPLIVNDNIELALELNASGVHLGQTDGDPYHARKKLGPDKIIGVSIDSENNLMDANEIPINYVGVGAIFKTANKPNVHTIWGLNGLQTLATKTHHPIVGIGGIHAGNALGVMAAGANGIAVIAALHDAKEPSLAASILRHLVDKEEPYVS